MPEKLRIFVSATTDLESVRGVVGRTLAELPVEIGAELRRCPAEGVSYDTLFELISNVDRVYFLLGQDITAPAGSEWLLAMELERPLTALRTPQKLTPAARQFLRDTSLQVTPSEWKVFRSEAELARIVALDLIDLLTKRAERFGLTITEGIRLQQHRQRYQPADAASHDPDGTGNSAVILDRRPVIESFVGS